MTDQTAQPDRAELTITAVICGKCGPSMLDKDQPRDKCPKCGRVTKRPPETLHMDHPAAAALVMPAPVMATIAARSIKQLLEDGDRTAAWDMLCRAWRACFELSLKHTVVSDPRGVLPSSVLLLREYFNHRGDWQEVADCGGLEEMSAECSANVDPALLKKVIDGSVESTVASAKKGLFAA